MRKYRRRRYRRRRKYFKLRWRRDDFRITNKYIWMLFFSLVSLAGIVYLGKAIYESPIFKVKEVKSDVNLDNNFKRTIIGQSLFALDTAAIHSAVVKNYPECKNIYVRKEFPSFLKIEAEKRAPFVQIRKKKFYPIDEEAVIINSGTPTQMVGIIAVEISGYDKPLRRGSVYDDERINYVFGLMRVLKQEKFFDRFSVELINATYPEAMYFIVADNSSRGSQVKVIIGKDNFERKLYLFGNVLQEKLEGNLASVKYIDLRYKKVYLGYKR
ncbi:MAG: hypothetical protein JSV34_00220 [Candidatus Omnitrophota bacterium]|nr:MAG: hypothetical protein JSV34_00220 [Candidatus Omnitrophota bacterium]